MTTLSIKELEVHEAMGWEDQRNSLGHHLFIHQTLLSAYCTPGFVVDTRNLGKENSFLGLSFCWAGKEIDAILVRVG